MLMGVISQFALLLWLFQNTSTAVTSVCKEKKKTGERRRERAKSGSSVTHSVAQLLVLTLQRGYET